MPPKKSTVEKSEDPVGLIKAYLTTQNRPYSAADVSANLHNAVTKTKCDKILKELAEKDEIEINDKGGKTSVYWAKQNASDSATPSELAALDAEIQALRNSIPLLKASQKPLATQLAKIRATPTTAALRTRVEALTADKEAKKVELCRLRSAGAKRVSEAERVATGREGLRWKTAREKRRRAFGEIEALIVAEGVKKDELWEACGIDDDPWV